MMQLCTAGPGKPRHEINLTQEKPGAARSIWHALSYADIPGPACSLPVDALSADGTYGTMHDMPGGSTADEELV